MLEVWSGGVNTWECDRMGHLNVRFYVAKAMEGLACLAAELGMPRAFAADASATLKVREHHIRFLREARPGGTLSMEGGVLAMGETDARLLLVMRHLDGAPAASFQVVVDHATAREGRAFPWPGRIRDRAAELTVETPDYAAARSIDLSPVARSGASLDRALALGLQRISLGAVMASDCDVFGRMRTEMFMARISEGMSRLGRSPGRTEAMEAKASGGAALEYRLVYYEHPRAGDRIEVRSAFSGAEEKTRRLFHWILDPQTGRPWGAAEAIVVSFDLETRKVITHSPAAREALMKTAIPEMTL